MRPGAYRYVGTVVWGLDFAHHHSRSRALTVGIAPIPCVSEWFFGSVGIEVAAIPRSY